ncbi:MAG: HEAT repeat domain-containing protein [Planctomycetota bacterium]
MNTVLRTLGIAVLLMTIVPAQAARRAESEPLQKWLTDLGAMDSRTWSAAMAQLTALGDRAVPALRQIVRRDGDQMANDAVRAVQVLQRIGVPAAVAVPDLLALLGRLGVRDNGRSAVILAVGELVPWAPTQRTAVREAMFDLLAQERLDGIGKLLQTSDYLDKCRAIARTEFGPETATDELAAGLAADNPFVREFAALLLADRDAAGEATIAALQKALRGPHPDRFQIAGLPQLEVFLDRRIQAAAARAMLRLAPKDPRSVEAFAVLAERTQAEDRLAAVIAVRQIGTAGAAMVPQLMRMAKDEDALIRREAITTLGTLGSTAAPAVALLEQLAADPDPQIAERARAALEQVRR